MSELDQEQEKQSFNKINKINEARKKVNNKIIFLKYHVDYHLYFHKKINDIEVFDQTYVNHFLKKLKKSYSGPITDPNTNEYHV
jgi:hypothetical protein